MFRETMCPSSGEYNVHMRHLVLVTLYMAEFIPPCILDILIHTNILIPTRIWLIPSRNSIIVCLLINKLRQEIKTILRKGKENKGNFIHSNIIIPYNLNEQFLRTIPIPLQQNKTPNTLTLAFPLWITFILFGWIKNKPYIEHLVPQGTPTMLIPLIVITENN